MNESGAELRLRAHVRAMRRVDAAVRVSESAAVALAAGGVCLAAARLSQIEALDRQAWIAAACCAVFAALAWSLEHRSSIARVVRRLDRAERLAGALVTAFDPRPCASELAPLLARRTAEHLAPRAGLRAMLPRSGIAYAAPLAALALIALAEELAEARAAVAEHARGEARLAELGGAIDGLPAADPSRPALLAALENARSGLRATAGDPQAQAGIERRLDELANELSAAERQRRSPRRAGVEDPRRGPEPRAHGTGASRTEERRTSETGTETAPPRPAPGGTPTAPDPLRPRAETADASEIPGASGVEAAPLDGTIPGRGALSGAGPAEAGKSSTELPVTASDPSREGGVGEGRWWPARHDQVVARWIEIAASGRQPSRAPTSLPPSRD